MPYKDPRIRKEKQKGYSLHHYEEHKDLVKQQVRDQKARVLKMLWDLKSNPCTDCKNRFHPAAMQWDHLPDKNKKADVSYLASCGNVLQMLEEIKKCELVCANCHAIRTFKRIRGVEVAHLLPKQVASVRSRSDAPSG